MGLLMGSNGNPTGTGMSSYSFTFDYLQNDFEKNLQRNLQNKTCSASVVQNVKNKETIHAYPMSIYIGSILSNLCTYFMQTCTSILALACVGINHKKGGD